MDPEIKTTKFPEIATEEISFGKKCSGCLHVKTCGAFRAFSEVLNEMESKYDFIKKPFQSESLAMTCQEFSPISLENGKAALKKCDCGCGYEIGSYEFQKFHTDQEVTN